VKLLEEGRALLDVDEYEQGAHHPADWLGSGVH